jgi:peptidoglycan hydrolase-like protein with peptidoglycan-binding domain
VDVISRMLTLERQLAACDLGVPVARVKDVILDDGFKVKPVSALLSLVAVTFGCMIGWNALFHQKHPQLAGGASATSAAMNPGTEVVVLKYDPLIQDAQREMLALGVYKGQVDGVFGQRTKQAIEAYQQLNGLAQTGLATPELITHMKFTHKVQAAAQYTGSVAPAAVDPVLATTPQATVVYEKAAAEANAAAKAKELTVKKVQVALAGLGYKIKKLDGRINAETRAAILKYEMDNGMDMTGTVDKALAQALKVE